MASILFASCATVPPRPPPDIERVSGTGYQGIIVSAELGRRGGYPETRLWMPTRRMVTDYERRLARRLPRERLPPADLWAKIRRRYFGMFEYGTSRKLMLVQLLCPAVYSEQYFGIPSFLFIPRDACM